MATPLSDLTGQALVDAGYAMQKRLEETEKKKREYMLDDPSVCSRCGQKKRAISKTLTELGLDSHPKADELGVVTWYAPCDNPECQAIAAQAMSGFSTDGTDMKLEQAIYRGSLGYAGIGGLNMQGLTLEGFNTEWPPLEEHRVALRSALDKMTAWSQDPQGTLILSGPYGIGKTRLAVGCLRNYLKGRESRNLPAGIEDKRVTDRRVGFHLACVEAWNMMKGLWGTNESAGRYRDIDITEAGLLRRAQQAGLLVLDDLDKVRPGETYLRWILSIMNYRSDDDRPTIITINRPVKQLGGHLKSQQGPKEPGAADAAEALMSRILYRAIPLQFSKEQPDFRKGAVVDG